MKNKKILITGARGFVGKNLVRHLNNVGYSNIIEIAGKESCDLTNQKLVYHLINDTKPDIIIHTAARVGGILANKNNPGLFIYENMSMGLNLIEASRKYGKLNKFIMLGTVCSYPKFTEVPFKEADFWNGYPEETNAPYGIAKKAITEMLYAYNKQYNFNSTTLVPCNMYGPNDNFDPSTSHVIPALILKIKNAIKNKSNNITVWGTGNASREFLYVDDCARAIELAINKDTGPEPINIGTGQEIKIKDLTWLLCQLMGFKGRVIYDENFPDGQPRRSLDVSRAKEILGFFSSIELQHGLEETLSYVEGCKI